MCMRPRWIPSPYSQPIFNEPWQLCSLSAAFHFDITTSVQAVYVALCTLKVCSFSKMKAQQTESGNTRADLFRRIKLFLARHFKASRSKAVFEKIKTYWFLFLLLVLMEQLKNFKVRHLRHITLYLKRFNRFWDRVLRHTVLKLQQLMIYIITQEAAQQRSRAIIFLGNSLPSFKIDCLLLD